jgi:pyruvate,water dikinase
MSQPDRLSEIANLPIDGVGLLRSEFMVLDALKQRHLQTWLQQDRQSLIDRLTQQIQQFAAAFAPRPVFYRSLDLRSHEFLGHSEVTQPEVNPMLGMRGTFSYCQNPDLFNVELAALRQVQQAGYSNLRLILPFVRTVEEFCFCRQQVEQAGLAQVQSFQLWIMAEVPSVLFLLEDYVKAGVQGIAIGTNDLTQLMLGVDRDQPQMATAFNPNHPAVLRAMQQLIQAAQQAKIPCSVCGQASHHLELVDWLVQWGVGAISIAPGEIEATYEAIERAERRLLLAAARRQLS